MHYNKLFKRSRNLPFEIWESPWKLILPIENNKQKLRSLDCKREQWRRQQQFRFSSFLSLSIKSMQRFQNRSEGGKSLFWSRNQIFYIYLKVSKSWKQFMVSSTSKKKTKKSTILSIFFTYRVFHIELFLLKWLWQIERWKLKFAWRYLYIPEVWKFEFHQPVSEKVT